MTKNNRNMTNSKAPWMGYIPSEWELYPTKRLFSISSGSTPESKNPDYWGEDIPWITPADFKTSTKYVSIGAKSITKNGYDSCSTELIPENSIVMSKRAPIGEVSLTLCPLCTNQGCLTCVPNDYADSNFYYYVLATASEQLKSLGNGTTFQELSATKFKEMKVVKPSLLEQQQIAAYLDEKCAKIDEAITKHRTLIEKLKEYRKAVITKAVTKGLDPNVDMKDSGIEGAGKIPSTWQVKRLKFIGRLTRGNGLSRSQITEEGLPCVRYGELYTTYNEKITDIASLTSKEIYDESNKMKDGDVAFTLSGENDIDIGRSVVNKSGQVLAYGGDMLVLHSFKENGVFLMYSFNSNYFNSQRTIVARGDIIVHLSAEKLSNMMVILPDKEIQDKIVEYLNTKCAKIDEAIARHEGLITKLEEYKKSIIYNAVTGKIDCRKDAE